MAGAAGPVAGAVRQDFQQIRADGGPLVANRCRRAAKPFLLTNPTNCRDADAHPGGATVRPALELGMGKCCDLVMCAGWFGRIVISPTFRVNNISPCSASRHGGVTGSTATDSAPWPTYGGRSGQPGGPDIVFASAVGRFRYARTCGAGAEGSNRFGVGGRWSAFRHRARRARPARVAVRPPPSDVSRIDPIHPASTAQPKHFAGCAGH